MGVKLAPVESSTACGTVKLAPVESNTANPGEKLAPVESSTAHVVTGGGPPPDPVSPTNRLKLRLFAALAEMKDTASPYAIPVSALE